MTTQPVFPKSELSWTDRIDQVNVVWAADVNSLAAEIVSIESTLGVMPQQEKAPYSGPAITYNTVDARLSDILAGNQMPYCSVSKTSDWVWNDRDEGTNWGHFNTYSKVYDPWGMYNGSDITIPTSGLYLITGKQQWGWHDSGYLWFSCYIDDDWECGYRWDWDFGEFGPGYYENDRYANTQFNHMTALAAGKRIRVVSENGTSFNPYPISNSWLRVFCLRKLPPNALG